MPCEICRSAAGEGTMLLCNSCGTGWHKGCLDPPVLHDTDDKWQCPRCVKQAVALPDVTKSTANVPRPPTSKKKLDWQEAEKLHGRFVRAWYPALDGKNMEEWFGVVNFTGGEYWPNYFELLFADGDKQITDLKGVKAALLPAGFVWPKNMGAIPWIRSIPGWYERDDMEHAAVRDTVPVPRTKPKEASPTSTQASKVVPVKKQRAPPARKAVTPVQVVAPKPVAKQPEVSGLRRSTRNAERVAGVTSIQAARCESFSYDDATNETANAMTTMVALMTSRPTENHYGYLNYSSSHIHAPTLHVQHEGGEEGLAMHPEILVPDDLPPASYQVDDPAVTVRLTEYLRHTLMGQGLRDKEYLYRMIRVCQLEVEWYHANERLSNSARVLAEHVAQHPILGQELKNYALNLARLPVHQLKDMCEKRMEYGQGDQWS